MTDLNCYITTFNCGRTLLDVNYLAANFFNGLKTNLPPDLVVLSLQEIAPIAYCFLGGSWLAPYLTRFISAVNVASSKLFDDEGKYEPLVVRNAGMTGIMVFARSDLYEYIRRIGTAGVGVGNYALGNKGAVGVRLGIGLGSNGDEEEEMDVTFVAAHLAPMEWDWQRRNKDFQAICEGLVFERDDSVGQKRSSTSTPSNEAEAEPLLSSSDHDDLSKYPGLYSPTSHLFIAGDLNYRTSDTGPDPDDHKGWPQPVESVSDIQHYSHLFERDQLTRELRKKATLHHLAESEIDFPPTYKYSDEASKQAADAPAARVEGEGQHWLWAKHRVPSWCDRILYLAAAPPKVNSYTALPVQPTSDHRPVALSFSIPRKPLKLPAGDVKPPYPIRKDWKEARAAARRYEVAVGVGAYLGLTWEGEALLAGTIVGLFGGYLALRTMIGT